jgi:predicted ATPase
VSQLEQWLDLAGMKIEEALPLIAELLNLPVPDRYRPLMFAPDQRRKRLLANLATWMLKLAAIQPVVIALEDLHSLSGLLILDSTCSAPPCISCPPISARQ